MLLKRSFRECVIERSEDLCATVLPLSNGSVVGSSRRPGIYFLPTI